MFDSNNSISSSDTEINPLLYNSRASRNNSKYFLDNGLNILCINGNPSLMWCFNPSDNIGKFLISFNINLGPLQPQSSFKSAPISFTSWYAYLFEGSTVAKITCGFIPFALATIKRVLPPTK